MTRQSLSSLFLLVCQVGYNFQVGCIVGLRCKNAPYSFFYELAENTHDFNREWFKLNGCKTALAGQKKDHSSIQLES